MLHSFDSKLFLSSFNKKEENFDSLRAYNDYLEMVETIGK